MWLFANGRHRRGRWKNEYVLYIRANCVDVGDKISMHCMTICLSVMRTMKQHGHQTKIVQKLKQTIPPWIFQGAPERLPSPPKKIQKYIGLKIIGQKQFLVHKNVGSKKRRYKKKFGLKMLCLPLSLLKHFENYVLSNINICFSLYKNIKYEYHVLSNINILRIILCQISIFVFR